MFFKVFLGELMFGREEGDYNKAKYVDQYTDNYFFCWLSMLVALFSDDKKIVFYGLILGVVLFPG